MYSRLLSEAKNWKELRQDFQWPHEAAYNIAYEICDKWAESEPDRVALIVPHQNFEATTYRFGEISRLSNQLANAFLKMGVGAGDRVALLLPQSVEVLLSHLALYKIGAIAVPLFTLFGPEGLQFRLFDSGARAVVTNKTNAKKLEEVSKALPDLKDILTIEDQFWPLLEQEATKLVRAETTLNTPAFISYTSGTTAAPKGALHAHKVLLGHLPTFELVHNMAPQEGDCFWTPADWAWLGGLCNGLFPALAMGMPVLSYRFERFDPELAIELIKRFGVRNSFLPPTALKIMKQANINYQGKLRSISSAGEPLGEAVLDWAKSAFGLQVNEFYGLTECNPVLANSGHISKIKPGSTGQAVPGHEVAILDKSGCEAPRGERGEIAIKKPDPSLFVAYWNQPERTEKRFLGDWFLTGDEAYQDEEGYFYFSSRLDDIISSSGYRVSPAEIENCLNQHPFVSMSAVIGAPDPKRGEKIIAYVVAMSQEVTDEHLKTHVGERLSQHLVPREVVFVKELPLTASGKIMRRKLRKTYLSSRGKL